MAAPSVYFVSDLHLGVGRDNDGHWAAIEDFRWHDDLKGFLDHISSTSGNQAQLVVLGDMLELWQSSSMACSKIGKTDLVDCRVMDCPGTETGCSERDAEARLANVVSHHQDTLRALGAFAGRGKNSLIIVPGNHDAALLLPTLANRLLGAINAPQGRATIELSGRWLSADGKVLAEHGHQFDDVNKFSEWPKPFHKHGGEMVLDRPGGEMLVQTFYNRYEQQFPTLDNFATETAGVGYAMKELRAAGVAVGIADFAHFLLFRSSIRQRVDWLGEQPAPGRVEWDVDKIKQLDDAQFVLYSLEPDSAERQVLADAYQKGELKGLVKKWDSKQIESLCDRAEVLAQRRERNGGTGPVIKRCPQKNGQGAKLGYFAKKLLLADDVALAAHLRDTNEKLPVAQRSFSIYVYGHTHSAKYPWTVEATPEWKVSVVNTGAFQRIASDKFVAQLPASVRDDPAFLSKQQPEQLPECYSFVTLKGTTAEPTAALRFWRRKDPQGSWGEASACDQ